MADLVSIIIPVFNSKKYLNRCIESIINQDYKDIEIILVNDGSTDESPKICDSYAKNDLRIRVIHTENSGPGAARNRGIEASRGDFVFFIDADDYIQDNALNLLVEDYRQHGADLTVCNFNKISADTLAAQNNGLFSKDMLLTKEDIIGYARCYLRRPNKFLLFAFSWGRLFKASVIRDNRIFFNPGLRTFEDVAFNFDYLHYANGLSFLKEPLYTHLVHDNYASATMMVSEKPEELFGYTQALANIGNFLRSSTSSADIKKEMGHAYITLTIIQLVRMCGQLNPGNRDKIYDFIRWIINDAQLRDNLQYYFPRQGDSKIMPLLMKLKLIQPLIWVSRYKARKRYGRGSSR